ncbi:MAG TPA: serine/threonine-protein kinase [Pyrinomonadaceae bacterium]|jgi:serine/threonine protein kinase
MIEAGKVLQGRYRVERQIGQGGMGAVFIATDERFGSTVAIKETFFTDEKFRKAFEREARLLNSLRHPALPRVSDHFIDGNGQFIVMEYIDGDDLSEQLEAEGKAFAVADVLGWAEQLLDALEYLHSQEMPVIHRDIKPQNLKSTTRGQIILLDFGLAKGNTTSAESATAAKSVFGYSRNYASLEQIQGTGTDPRSDLYSLAATLYHLLTGVPPADALTRAMNVLSNKPDPLIDAHEIRPEIPVGVSRLLSEAMALNAEERPASANAMREWLLEVKDEPPSSEARTLLNVPSTNIFSQKTQLYGDASRVSKLKQSDILTETFANDESKITQLKPRVVTGDFEKHGTKVDPLAGNAEKNKKSRRRLVVGAALGGLLLALVGAAAVFVAEPEAFDVHRKQESTEPEKKMIIVKVPEENVSLNDANTNAANANAVAAAPVAPATTPVVPTESKPKETTARVESKPTEPKPKNELLVPNRKYDAVTIDEPPDIYVDAEPDAAGNPPTDPKTKQKFPVMVWRKMTPEQRRKLREALDVQRLQEMERRKFEIQKRNLPKPQPPAFPTPNN